MIHIAASPLLLPNHNYLAIGFRSKQAMYWICRPCKNNRHDLCVRQTSSRCDSEPKILCWCSSQPTHQAALAKPSGENAKSLPR